MSTHINTPALPRKVRWVQKELDELEYRFAQEQAYINSHTEFTNAQMFDKDDYLRLFDGVQEQLKYAKAAFQQATSPCLLTGHCNQKFFGKYIFQKLKDSKLPKDMFSIVPASMIWRECLEHRDVEGMRFLLEHGTFGGPFESSFESCLLDLFTDESFLLVVKHFFDEDMWDVSETMHGRFTPLMIAVRYRNLPAVEWLLQQDGIDVNVKGPEMNIALHYCFLQPVVLKDSRQKTSDDDESSSSIYEEDSSHEEDPEPTTSAFIDAAKLLLRCKEIDVRAKNETGEDVFSVAIQGGSIGAELMLRDGRSDISQGGKILRWMMGAHTGAQHVFAADNFRLPKVLLKYEERRLDADPEELLEKGMPDAVNARVLSFIFPSGLVGMSDNGDGKLSQLMDQVLERSVPNESRDLRRMGLMGTVYSNYYRAFEGMDTYGWMETANLFRAHENKLTDILKFHTDESI